MLRIIRGLPGSGKSTLAMELCGELFCHHVEADKWFASIDEYKFDSNELESAHLWCILETEYCLRKGKGVIVSNIFILARDIAPYYVLSKKYSVDMCITTLPRKFEIAHGIPDTTIKEMERLFQPDNVVKEKLNKLDYTQYIYSPYESIYDPIFLDGKEA